VIEAKIIDWIFKHFYALIVFVKTVLLRVTTVRFFSDVLHRPWTNRAFDSCVLNWSTRTIVHPSQRVRDCEASLRV